MQEVQFVTAPDGVKLAVSTMGAGPPLIVVSSWLSHLELDLHESVGRPFFEGLARRNLLIRYDKRGMGLSDRNVGDYSLAAQVRDLHAIIESLGLRGVTLLGSSQGGPISIAYAVEHPENVSRLIIFGAFHNPAFEGLYEERQRAILALVRADWGGLGTAPMLEIFIPGASPEMRDFFTFYQREAASGEEAAAVLEGCADHGVTSLLPEVRAATLVLHRRGDRAIPIQQGREIASLIPGARFVPLEGDVHLPFWGDTEPLLAAIEDFLSGQEGPRTPAKTREGLRTILFTDMEGSTAVTRRLGDARAQQLLRTHDRIVREAVAGGGGSEIKHTGDGIMASFPSASGALGCAVAIQRAVSSHNQAERESEIGVRVGMNAGEPVAEEDPGGRIDLFGTAVQLARRICDEAKPGQILASELVHGLAAGGEFRFAEQGGADLKGFDAPVRLYDVAWRD